MKKISKAVYKETGYIALWTVILSAVLQGVFLIARRWTGYILIDNAVTAVFSVLNFFLMGLTVQKAVGKSEQNAQNLMRVSQMLRNLMMAAVIVGCVVIHMQFTDKIIELVPNIIALFIPAFFPRFAILVRAKSVNTDIDEYDESGDDGEYEDDEEEDLKNEDTSEDENDDSASEEETDEEFSDLDVYDENEE